MRAARMLCVAVIVLSASLVAAGASEATFPGRNGVIAFTGQSQDVYTVKADGSDQTRITTTTNSAAPAFAPDGKTILTSTKGSDLAPHLAIVDADGGDPEAIPGTKAAYAPTFAASGERVAYSSKGAIKAVNVDGKKAKTLIKGGAFSPAFSPTGALIAFVQPDTKLHGDPLYVMDGKGRNVKQLTSVKKFDVSSPSWTPDGKRIVFAGGDGRHSDLYVVDANGKHLEQLTDTDDVDEQRPAPSPDGKLIAYDDGSDIFIVDADGSNPTQVTSARADEYDPDWQPLG